MEANEIAVELSGRDPSLAVWLEALSHDSPFERPQAAAVGDRAAPPLSAIPSLISLLRDPNKNIRTQAVTALGKIGGQAHGVLRALHTALKETALKDRDEAVRAQAARALLEVGPQPASEIGALIDSLQDELDLVRFHAAIALGDCGRDAQPAVPVLIHTALWDEDPAVRVEAAVALWKIDRRGPLVVPALIKALGDENELICWIAADCLGQIGPEAQEAIPALRQTLSRPFKISLIGRGVALALQRIEPQAAARAGAG